MVRADGCLDATATTPWATILINSCVLTTRIQRRRSWLADSARLISIVRIQFVVSSLLVLCVKLAYTYAARETRRLLT